MGILNKEGVALVQNVKEGLFEKIKKRKTIRKNTKKKIPKKE